MNNDIINKRNKCQKKKPIYFFLSQLIAHFETLTDNKKERNI